MVGNNKSTVIKSGERLDILSNRIYGSSYKYQLLIDDNPRLNIWSPKPGTVIKVRDAGQ